MREYGKLFLIALLAAAVSVACVDAPTNPPDQSPRGMPELSASDNFTEDNGHSGPSANGQALTPNLYGLGLQTVSFHAREKKDGTVVGSFESKSRGQDVEVHGDIDCLVVDGNEAIVGGVFTQVRLDPETDFVAEVGWRFWMMVRDNGEGHGSPPDEFSDWYGDFPPYLVTVCEPIPYGDFPDFFAPLLEAEANIQVKP